VIIIKEALGPHNKAITPGTDTATTIPGTNQGSKQRGNVTW